MDLPITPSRITLSDEKFNEIFYTKMDEAKLIYGTVWNNGKSTWGIRVGRLGLKYFDEKQPKIIIDLDGIPHDFMLSKSFFRGDCQEVRGKVIGDWYQKHKIGMHNKRQIRILIESLEDKKRFRASLVPK